MANGNGNGNAGTRISNPVGVSLTFAFGLWAAVLVWAANYVVKDFQDTAARLERHTALPAHGIAGEKLGGLLKTSERVSAESLARHNLQQQQIADIQQRITMLADKLENHDDWGRGDHAEFRADIKANRVEIERLKQ